MTILVLSRSPSFEQHLAQVFAPGGQLRFYTSPDEIDLELVADAKLVLIHASSFTDEIEAVFAKLKSLSLTPVGVASDIPSLEEMLRLSRLGALAYFNSFMADLHYRQMEQLLLIGHRWFIPELLESAIRIAYDTVVTSPAVVLADLTLREKEVALVVARGLSNKDIARQCGITERTVKAHLTNIFKKCAVSDRVSLAILINAGSSPVAVSD